MTKKNSFYTPKIALVIITITVPIIIFCTFYLAVVLKTESTAVNTNCFDYVSDVQSCIKIADAFRGIPSSVMVDRKGDCNFDIYDDDDNTYPPNGIIIMKKMIPVLSGIIDRIKISKPEQVVCVDGKQPVTYKVTMLTEKWGIRYRDKQITEDGQKTWRSDK